jgi:HEAT repeat protein
MVTLRKRWRLRTLMGLVVLAALGMAFLRKTPDLGPVYRLKHADPQGRMSAAVQLGMLGSKKGKFAEPALLAALSDPNQGVCDSAAWALPFPGQGSSQAGGGRDLAIAAVEVAGRLLHAG